MPCRTGAAKICNDDQVQWQACISSGMVIRLSCHYMVSQVADVVVLFVYYLEPLILNNDRTSFNDPKREPHCHIEILVS